MPLKKPLRLRLVYFLDWIFNIEKIRGHSFYSKGLNAASIILDLGGNLGAFSKAVASKYGSRTFIIEASPELFAKIDESPSTRKYNYAVSGRNGFAVFHESRNIEAGNIIAPKSNSTGKTFKVESRNFTSLVSELGLDEIDLLKIDIEGAEIEVFDTITNEDLKAVKQITIEFHDSVPIPNVATEDVKRIIEKIISMGFEGIQCGRKNSDWMFINKNHPYFNAPARLYLNLRKLLPKRPD